MRAFVPFGTANLINFPHVRKSFPRPKPLMATSCHLWPLICSTILPRRPLHGSPAAPSFPWKYLRFTIQLASLEKTLHRKMPEKPSSTLRRRVSYSPPEPPSASAPRGYRKPRRTKIQLTWKLFYYCVDIASYTLTHLQLTK